MCNKKGFTLIELLVVMSIIALLVAIMMPSIMSVREAARRAMCMTNLNVITKGLSYYHGENNHAYPWLRGTAWNCLIGTNRGIEPAAPWLVADARSISSILYVFVRRGTNVSAYVCPSDEKAEPDPSANPTRYWDFDGRGGSGTTKRHLSYSYVAPLYGGNEGQYVSGINYQSVQRITTTVYEPVDPSKVATVADKNPVVDGSTIAAWSDTMSEFDRKRSNSQNHSNGEMQNILWGDGSARPSYRADVGWRNDNIFTASNSVLGGSRTTTDATSLGSHRCEVDSFLIGPYY